MTPTGHHMTRAAAILTLLALAGCGTGQETTAADDDAAASEQPLAEDAVAEEPEPESESEPVSEAASEAASVWCEQLPTDEVTAMFDGVLELTDQRPIADTGCQWSVAGAEGEGLMVGLTQTGSLENKRETFAEQEGMEVAEPDIGADALLLNDADLTIATDDGREILVAVQAFWVDEPAPDLDGLGDGIVELGGTVVDRLG